MEPPGLTTGLVPSMAAYQACLAMYNQIKSFQYSDETESLMLGLTREHQRFSTLVPQLIILQQPVSQQLVEGSLKEFKVTLEEFHDVVYRFTWTDDEPGYVSRKPAHDVGAPSTRDKKRLTVLISRLRDLNDQLSYLMPEIQLAGSPSKLMAYPVTTADAGRKRNVKNTADSLASEVEASDSGRSTPVQGVDLTRLLVGNQVP